MMDMIMPGTVTTSAAGSTGTAGTNTDASAGGGDFLALLNALLPEVEADTANAEAAVTEALVELAQLGQREGEASDAGAWPIPALLARFIASAAPQGATPPVTEGEAAPMASEEAAPVPSQQVADELTKAELAKAETAGGQVAADELANGATAGDQVAADELAKGETAGGQVADDGLTKGATAGDQVAADVGTGASVGSEQNAVTDGADPALQATLAVVGAKPGAAVGTGAEAADGTVPAAREGSAPADGTQRPTPPGTGAAANARTASPDGSSATDVSSDAAQGETPPMRSESGTSPTLRIDTAEPTDGLRGVASTEGETAVREAVAARDASARGSSAHSSAASVQRVLDAVELLEKSPPPRYLTLELTDGRLRVSIEEGQVRLELLGERGEDADRLLEDAREALEERGFDLERDHADDGDEHQATAATGSSPPPRPRVPAGLRL